jgi:hypothetical protein
LVVSNVGAASPWPCGAAIGRDQASVRVGARWFDQDAVGVTESRAELPATLMPGQAARVDLRLVARDAHGAALPPGTYDVTVGLVQEGVSWFADHGDGVLNLQVVVR